MKGFNVLHPMGWDSFGLPAENYAIKTGTHPDLTTQENIKYGKLQRPAPGPCQLQSSPVFSKWQSGDSEREAEDEVEE